MVQRYDSSDDFLKLLMKFAVSDGAKSKDVGIGRRTVRIKREKNDEL